MYNNMYILVEWYHDYSHSLDYSHNFISFYLTMPPKKKIDVHKKLSSRPECYICGKSFKNRRGLTTHLKTCSKNLERKKKINLTATQQFQKRIGCMNTNKNSERPIVNDICPPMDIPFIQNEQYDSEPSPMIPDIDNDSSILASIHENTEENDHNQKENTSYTDNQLSLINQEATFQQKMKNAHHMWSNDDLGKLELLKILQKHKCPNSAYDDIFGWASHYNNLKNSSIFDKKAKRTGRNAFMNELKGRRNMENMKPIKKSLYTKRNDPEFKIDITTFDFKQQLLSLLRDEELMHPSNLVLDEPGKKPQFDDKISEIQDSDWYRCAYAHYNERYGIDKNRVICGIILTVDKTHTDRKGKLCLEPVQFTLSILKTEVRKKMASAWRCLGFINDLDSYLGSKLYIENDSEDEDTINDTQVIDDQELNQV